MATVFTIMAYGGMALAVICLVIAIILFIKWDIRKVFGDITGRTERKTIERIRSEGYEMNASKQTSIKKSGETGRIRVRRTETDSLTKETGQKDFSVTENSGAKSGQRESAATREENLTNTVLHVYNPEGDTMVLNTSEEEDTTVLSSSEEETTTVLSTSEEDTAVLSSPEEEDTTVLSTSEEDTTVLSSPEEEATTVLNTSEQEEGQDGGGEEMHPSEESTTILTDSRVEGVIQLPQETFTQPGTVAKVLDFIVTHTDAEIV